MNREKIYTVDGNVVQYKEVVLNELDLSDLYRVHRNIKRDMDMCKDENNKIIKKYNVLENELKTVEECINKLGGIVDEGIEVIV